jgi:hypothetical protein
VRETGDGKGEGDRGRGEGVNCIEKPSEMAHACLVRSTCALICYQSAAADEVTLGVAVEPRVVIGVRGRRGGRQGAGQRGGQREERGE